LVFSLWYFDPQGSPLVNFLIQAFTLNFLTNLFVSTIVIFTLLELLVYIAFKRFTPSDVKTPKDERERLIELKGVRIAYSAFILLEIMVAIAIVHLSVESAGGWAVGSWLTGNLVLVPIVLSLLINYTVQIFYFHRES